MVAISNGKHLCDVILDINVCLTAKMFVGSKWNAKNARNADHTAVTLKQFN